MTYYGHDGMVCRKVEGAAWSPGPGPHYQALYNSYAFSAVDETKTET
jgi:hypothetical protein